jgi:DNA-directed RNA polymerase specialized sigma24 family protein
MGTPGGFPATRHSIIQRIRDDNPDTRRAAFGDLVEGYWKPVYKHLRVTWRLDADEARDLTQGFFTEAFEKAWLERFEPGKARFRTFVRVCADRFVMNARQAQSRLKRGGGVQAIPLDFDGADRELLQHQSTPSGADEFFQQEFIRALFERALSALRADFASSGRSLHYTLFERYDIAPTEGVSYAALAEEFGLTTIQVTNHLAQVRRAFRTRALDALRGLCGTDDEFQREAREIFGLDLGAESERTSKGVRGTRSSGEE